MKAPLPPNEAERLAALRRYGVLDTAPEAAFDELTQLAAYICEAPIALITLIDEDRQWFKSRIGLNAAETARDVAFCAHAIHQADLCIVPDATQDARFADNPFVMGEPRIRFYAGAPLVTPEGHVLGTLCVIDLVPRTLSVEHQEALRVLSRHVMHQLELVRRSRELAEVHAERDAALAALRREQAATEKKIRKRTAALAASEAATRKHSDRSDLARRALLSLIEDQKLVEQALRDAKEFSENLIQTANVMILSLDAEGNIDIFNQTAEKITGYTLAEAKGKNWFELLVPKDRYPYVWEEFNRLIAGGMPKAFENPIVTKSGEERYIMWQNNQVIAEGKVISTISIGNDITERRRAERALRESQAGLESAQEQARLGSWELDVAAQRGSWSREMFRLFDRDPARGPPTFQEFKELVHPEDRPAMMATYARAVESGEPASLDFRSDPARGPALYFHATLHGDRDAAGRVVRLVGTVLDVTERKQAEQKVARLNRVYAMLSGINSVIVRVREWQELFDEACRLAVTAGKFHSAWIGLLDTERGNVRPVAFHEVDAEFLARLSALFEPEAGPPRGVIWRAVQSKRVVVSNDIAQDSQTIRLRDMQLARGIRALAVLPLLVSEEVAGVLVLYARETGFFDATEMELLGEVAGDIAFGLDHIRKEERINYLAYYDSLTGLANRALFHERLTQFIHTAQRERRKLALGVVDLDHFKDVNDALGRQTGDGLLAQFAQRLTLTAEDTSQVARLGADGFVLVLPDIQDEDDASCKIEGVMTGCVGQPFRFADTELRISAKVGIALYPQDGMDADALFRNAEAALKKAKATGERTLFYTGQMTERVAEKLTLENKLRRALEREEFTLYYQPKVEAETRRIVGMEALLRWTDPETGPVPPTKFISLLERTGIILEVGTWVIRRAVEDQRYWLEQGIAAPRIAVNVSAAQLHQNNFVDVVREAVGRGTAPATIELEITESLIVQDMDVTVEKLRAIREFGVSIAIDDFGTGYSSLAYLARLPVQLLKIDLSFVARMLSSPDVMTLVSTMISLGHSLRLKVIAEGVETEKQANALQRLGCDELQGYLISIPLPRDQMTELLLQNRPAVRPGKRKRR